MIELNKYIREGLLSDFDDFENSQDKDMVKYWCQQNLTGEYNVVVLKNKTIKLRGNVILKNYEDDNFPFTIVEMHGNLSIEKCPNITSLEGLFANVMKIYGNLSINNCPKLKSLKGCPFIIDGSLSITGNRSLKTIDYMPDIVQGTIYVMKNGRRFKEEDIQKANSIGSIVTRRIVCSYEEDENLINENLINEAVSEPHLLEIAEILKKSKYNLQTIFSKIHGPVQSMIPWDKLDSTNVTEYNKIDSKVKTIVRNIISGKEHRNSGVMSFIFLKNYKDEYTWIITDSKYINNFRNIVANYSNHWSAEKSSYIMDLVDDADSLIVISVSKEERVAVNDLRQNRRVSKLGVVYNTPEYYQKLVRENMQRYKNLLQQRRAAGYIKGMDDDELDDRVKKLIEDTLNATSKLSKEFKPTKNISIYDDNHNYQKIQKITNTLTNMMNMYTSYTTSYVKFKEYYGKYQDMPSWWQDHKKDAEYYHDRLKRHADDLEKMLKGI